MSSAAISILAWGIYLLGFGTSFLLIPNVPLSLFGFDPATDVWIRVLGVVLVGLGYYHIRAAREEMTAFFSWTVHGRGFAVICFVMFVILKLTKPILLLFAGIETLGLLWTALTLRSPKPTSAPPM